MLTLLLALVLLIGFFAWALLHASGQIEHRDGYDVYECRVRK